MILCRFFEELLILFHFYFDNRITQLLNTFHLNIEVSAVYSLFYNFSSFFYETNFNELRLFLQFFIFLFFVFIDHLFRESLKIFSITFRIRLLLPRLRLLYFLLHLLSSISSLVYSSDRVHLISTSLLASGFMVTGYGFSISIIMIFSSVYSVYSAFSSTFTSVLSVKDVMSPGLIPLCVTTFWSLVSPLRSCAWRSLLCPSNLEETAWLSFVCNFVSVNYSLLKLS